MDIINNRSFFRDFITEDLTKKDLALNLIPPEGIASVAYEIGSARLSYKNHTAKISQDFLKSSIQTTLKKIHECIWVPIIVCGALKLVSLIVNTCWNRCFLPTNNRPRKESQVIDIDRLDPSAIIPPTVVVSHIFSCLNIHELGVSRNVSRRWNQFANAPILWQSAIYREIAFSSKDWNKWNADFVKDVDMRQEMLSLPKNIMEELRRAAFAGKSIRETHVLVRMPKGLTLKKLREFVKKYFPINAIYGFIESSLGNKPVDESVWLLMTKDLLPGSRSKSYSQQKNIIAKLAKTAQIAYQIPTTLEAAICILAEYSRSEKHLFSGSYAICQDYDFQGCQIVVGGCDQDGLYVTYDIFVIDSFGVAALRKF